ncbi:hypothetical protein BC829DRAFT_116478 [Chytridium lagenaria]|nr:hypothetical protein BC829DRAFT_116478 [Chytridium lagenaria]
MIFFSVSSLTLPPKNVFAAMRLYQLLFYPPLLFTLLSAFLFCVWLFCFICYPLPLHPISYQIAPPFYSIFFVILLTIVFFLLLFLFVSSFLYLRLGC